MKQIFSIGSLIRRSIDSFFDTEHIVARVLSAFMTQTYEISRIARLTNLSESDLTNILTHARIEITDNCITESGIRVLADREVGKIKVYFEQSLANYSSLSNKEKRTFDAFLKRYGIKYRQIRTWKDLKVEAIRKDCYNELIGASYLTFYDGKYICYEDLEITDQSQISSIIQLIRSSLMYNMKSMRKWIQFKPMRDSTVAYILTHHFHIFTTDDSDNSILTADKSKMFHLPQNAKHYILAA